MAGANGDAAASDSEHLPTDAHMDISVVEGRHRVVAKMQREAKHRYNSFALKTSS